MTTYKKNDRRRWRHVLKRLQWRINYALALLALLAAILVQPAPASAQARWDYCYRIPHGRVCVARATKVTQITCDWGYQPQFGRAPRCITLEALP